MLLQSGPTGKLVSRDAIAGCSSTGEGALSVVDSGGACKIGGAASNGAASGADTKSSATAPMSSGDAESGALSRDIGFAETGSGTATSSGAISGHMIFHKLGIHDT